MPSAAISGASSFSGGYIAAAFADREWQTHALYTRASAGDYDALRRARMARQPAAVASHFGCRAESGELAEWIARFRPTIWVHHHHWMDDFRSPSYDVVRADAIGLSPLDQMVAALAACDCKGVIYSGTYFEPGEGGHDDSYAATPYAQSKRRVWLRLQELCRQLGLALSRVVIPSPTGPLENSDRFVPSLLRLARDDQPLTLRSPQSVADNLPVQTLAEEYVRIADCLLAGEPCTSRPSGLVCTVEEWAQTVNDELLARLAIPAVRIVTGESPTPLTVFRNSDPVTVRWRDFWDDYAAAVADQPWR